MTETEDKPQELTLQQHALQEIDAVAAGIAELTTKYKGVVYDVATTDGMEQARKARADIREPRYKIENIRKGKISELRQIGNKINERAADITQQIRDIEDPIHAQIAKEEERKEAEREAKAAAIRAEQQRQQDIIAAIRRIPLDLVNASVDVIDAATTELLERTLALDEVYAPDGERAKDDVLASLTVLRAQRVASGEQQAELLRLREQAAAREQELAEQRAIEDAAKAARDAEEQEHKARMVLVQANIERIRQLSRSAIAQPASVVSALLEQANETAITEADFDGYIETATLERQRVIDELIAMYKAAVESEAAQALLKAHTDELERLAAEQRKRDEAAEAIRRAEEEAAQREQDRIAQEEIQQCIAAATLPEAARLAAAFLQRHGHGDAFETQMLLSALAKESAGKDSETR